MINKILLIVIVALIISCTPQKGNDKKNKIEISEQPTGITEISFNEKIHDFGKLISGEIVVATFVLTNSGNYNLIIEDVKSDCGCVKVSFPKEPIKPQATGLIEVEFDSSGMFGKQFKSIELVSNCKEQKSLAVFAEIENERLEIRY